MDPFTMVYDGLWNMMLANATLVSYFKSGNLYSYRQDKDPKGKINKAGDTPELQLFQMGMSEIDSIFNSNTSDMTMQYRWQVTTASFNIEEPNRIFFELIRSMCCWQHALCPLTWNNCNFVKSMDMTSSQETVDVTEASRRIHGWNGNLFCYVRMNFPTLDLTSGICTP